MYKLKIISIEETVKESNTGIPQVFYSLDRERLNPIDGFSTHDLIITLLFIHDGSFEQAKTYEDLLSPQFRVPELDNYRQSLINNFANISNNIVNDHLSRVYFKLLRVLIDAKKFYSGQNKVDIEGAIDNKDIWKIFEVINMLPESEDNNFELIIPTFTISESCALKLVHYDNLLYCIQKENSNGLLAKSSRYDRYVVEVLDAHNQKTRTARQNQKKSSKSNKNTELREIVKKLATEKYSDQEYSKTPRDYAESLIDSKEIPSKHHENYRSLLDTGTILRWLGSIVRDELQRTDLYTLGRPKKKLNKYLQQIIFLPQNTGIDSPNLSQTKRGFIQLL